MFHLALRQTKQVYTDNCSISPHGWQLVKLTDMFEPCICIASRNRKGNTSIASIPASYFRLYKGNSAVTVVSEKGVCFSIVVPFIFFFLPFHHADSHWLPVLAPGHELLENGQRFRIRFIKEKVHGKGSKADKHIVLMVAAFGCS